MSTTQETLADTLDGIQFDLNRFGIVSRDVLKHAATLTQAAESWEDDVQVKTAAESARFNFLCAFYLNDLALKDVDNGEIYLRLALRDWVLQSNYGAVYFLENTCKRILEAKARASASQMSYQRARDGFQSIFDGIVKERGPDFALRVKSTTAEDSKDVNNELITVGRIATETICYIEELKKLAQDFCFWLSGFYDMLQEFLQDDTISFCIPLMDVPFVCPDWSKRLEALSKLCENARFQTDCAKEEYPHCFINLDGDYYTHTQGDVGKLGTDPPRSKAGCIESDEYSDSDDPSPQIAKPLSSVVILEGVFSKTSRVWCEMILTKIDQKHAGKSSLAMSFDLQSSFAKPRYRNVIISCGIQPLQLSGSQELLTSSVCITDYNPKQSQDLELESYRAPSDWKPQLTTTHSTLGVEWTFFNQNPPWKFFNSSAPCMFNLALDIDHDVAVSLNVGVKIVRRRYPVGIGVDECEGRRVIPLSKGTTEI